MEERREGDEREWKGKDRRGGMKWKRSGMREGRRRRTGEEKRKGELKGSRYASVGVGPDWARVSTRFSGAGIAGTREQKQKRERKRKQTECEANEEEDKRDIGEKGSLVRERRDRVPGGQDRFELSKIYGRRFDLRARGVTPGSLGQGP